MRLPRVRFTVRRMMITLGGIAVVIGAGAWAERMWQRSRQFRDHAAVHGAMERLLLSHGITQDTRYHTLMRRKYEVAASQPWRRVAPDPRWHPAGAPDPDPAAPAAGDPEGAAADGPVRVTVEVIPKPDGEPYRDGEPIRCKGRLTWGGVEPPGEVLVVLQPGLFPDTNFAKCNEAMFPVKGEGGGSRPGTSAWEGSIRANRVSEIEDYIVVAYPFSEHSGPYVENGRPMRAFARLKIPR